MACILNGGRLTLSGYVGDNFWDDGFTYADVVVALATIDDDADLTVHINSGGGVATDGTAIHALLSRRSGKTDVVIEGIAASAASLIAMAGETVTMTPGSTAMVHDPAGLTFGDAAAHAKTIEALDALATAYSRVYAQKTGKTPAECREIMKVETWFNADEAVAAGFADAIEGESGPVAAYPYQMYARAPKRLVALAQDKGWRSPRAAMTTAAPSAAPTARKETPMSDKQTADDQAAALETARAEAAAGAVKADRERRQSIMALDEAKGREALAEHLYATTEMSAEQIKATLAIAPKAEETPVEDYGRARLAGAGLGGTPKAAPAADGWKAAAAKINNRR